jgi:ribosome maturation factor RimP
MVRGRGTKSPFFMEESKIIENTVKGTINSNCDLFLIDFKIENEKINVTIDGDRGVSIKDCAGISREIEFILSKNNLNFAINVSSFCTSSPLVNLRQFKKNIGRELDIFTKNNDKIVGKLISLNKDSIILEWSERVPKIVGKGKRTVKFYKELDIKDIKKAIVKINYSYGK